MAEGIVLLGSVVAAILSIGGIAVAIIKWVLHQNKQSADIQELRNLHKTDIEATKKKESEDIQEIKDELCVISYAMLASLDGLMQLHCNGNVSKAHDRLEKHLNQQAHGQFPNGSS